MQPTTKPRLDRLEHLGQRVLGIALDLDWDGLSSPR